MSDVRRDSECAQHEAAGTELLELYSDDCPDAPGGPAAQDGDARWLLCLPLVDGKRLHLYLGRKAHKNFSDMLAAEATDDAEDQL